VICVGNFTAGGTGKTPLVIHLCEHLKAAGHEPVALTRGYGGRLAGPYRVAKSDSSRDVGDEALLLAQAVPTFVARDRGAGARAIENGPHPVTLIVMDDGLQNPGLTKDLTIAVVDGRRGIGNGKVIPAGPLRATLGFQLELPDVVVVNETVGCIGSPVAEWFRRRFAGPVLRANTVPAEDTQWLKDCRVIAWAGIGAPERFFALLGKQRATIAKTIAFPDHHYLTEADARGLLDLAREEKAILVTTEKDMVRIAGTSGSVGELAALSQVLPVKLSFADTDGERLSALVGTALETRR
jgi:tetraacyldisaccharide 4'-kinase